jgi:hypothetical protein
MPRSECNDAIAMDKGRVIRRQEQAAVSLAGITAPQQQWPAHLN